MQSNIYLGVIMWLKEAKRILKDTGSMIVWSCVEHKPLIFARFVIMIEDEKILIFAIG